MDTPLQEWEQQPGEKSDAYAQFLIYLKIGPGRTLNKAFQLHLVDTGEADAMESAKRRTPGSWTGRASKWRWHIRATAWDAYQRRTLFESEMESVRSMYQRHSKAGRAIFNIGIGELAKLQKLQAGEDNPDELKLKLRPVDILNYVQSGIDIERLSLADWLMTSPNDDADDSANTTPEVNEVVVTRTARDEKADPNKPGGEANDGGAVHSDEDTDEE